RGQQTSGQDEQEGRPYISTRTGTTCRGDPPVRLLTQRINRQVTVDDISLRVLRGSEKTNLPSGAIGGISCRKQESTIDVRQEGVVTHNNLQRIFDVVTRLQSSSGSPVRASQITRN